MTAANFPVCLDFVLQQEGGWSDDPGDPGGATLNGITLQTLRDYRGDQSLTADDLRAMQPAERDAIYRTRYWDAVRGDDLPVGIDLCVFDFAVNAGPSRSAKLLQRVVGTDQDGIIGPVTIAAANAVIQSQAIMALCVDRIAYYRSLNMPEFIRGWTNRANACEAAALAMLT